MSETQGGSVMTRQRDSAGTHGAGVHGTSTRGTSTTALCERLRQAVAAGEHDEAMMVLALSQHQLENSHAEYLAMVARRGELLMAGRELGLSTAAMGRALGVSRPAADHALRRAQERAERDTC